MTYKYAGRYSYGSSPEKGRVGTILIYPETDTTVLFNIDISLGPPSYNMGQLYGRLKLKSDTCLFYTKFEFAEMGCKWRLVFSKNKLTILTIDDQDGCGFGHSVYADNVYKLVTRKIVNYFEDMEGTKIYFNKTSPEDYYKN